MGVHGFRYTTRTVFRTLQERYEKLPRKGVEIFPWFDRTHGGAVNFEDLMAVPLWKKLLSRVLTSAASYEMVGGALVDGLVFDYENLRCVYVEEMTEDSFHKRYGSHMRMTFGFYAGGAPSGDSWKNIDQSVMRFPEFAPIAHPFHAVLQFFQDRKSYDPNWREKLTPGDNFTLSIVENYLEVSVHSSSIWPISKHKSYRFHFKAERLGDYTNSGQVPVLDNFLRDVEEAVLEQKAMARRYHE